jgi:hypothetical protein
MNANKEIDGSVAVTGDVAVEGAVNVGGQTTLHDTKVMNNLTVRGWLSAANVKDAFKGIFGSVAALNAAIRNPEDGWIAGVMGQNSHDEDVVWTYYSSNGAWTATGGTMPVEGDIVDVDVLLSAIEDRALKSEMSVDDVSSDKKKIRLYGGDNPLEVTVLTSHLSLSNYVQRSEILVGSGSDSTKRNLQLKNGLTQAVVVEHQSLAGKADAASVYTKAAVNGLLSRVLGETLRVEFAVSHNGQVNLVNKDLDYVPLMLVTYMSSDGDDGRLVTDMSTDGAVYIRRGIDHPIGVTAYYFFPDPTVIPDEAFSGVWDTDEGVEIVKIHLPSCVHAIGGKAFAATQENADTLVKVECEGMTPPTVNTTSPHESFENVDLSSTELFVHKTVRENYEEDGFWGGWQSGAHTYIVNIGS